MIRPPLGSTLVAVAALTFMSDAHAVPSYSRQTGMPCASCHYAPPELKAFARQFKLEGYTSTTEPEITDDKKDHNAALHLLEAFPLSIIFDASFTAIKSPQPATQNGNFQFPQAASLFLAGAWTSHVGSFVQVSYDSQSDHFSWDNTDIRSANHGGKLFGSPILNVSWWPQQNVDTGYFRFNGARVNYDGAGRDASGNNAVYLLARFVF